MKRSTSAVRLCLVLSIASLSLILSSASAQDIEYEKVMIPISYNRPVSIGGGVFETRVTIVNTAPVTVQVGPYDYGCNIGTCELGPVPPGVTFSPRLGMYNGWSEGEGIFLYVEKEYVDEVALELRVHEGSRHEAWGAKIPIVRERDLRSDKVHLLRIPISVPFRQTVRIYDFDARGNSRVLVRMFGTRSFLLTPFNHQPPDPLLFEGEFTFDRVERSGAAGYIQLGDLRALAGPTHILYDTVRLEIESRTEGLRFWAFASVNNSASQSLSIISP